MNSSIQVVGWPIKLEGLTVGYDNRVVLDNINAELPSGKISMILGSSGCGKSTLLRHIVGLRRPMSGKILLGPYDIFSLPVKKFRSLRRRMGMLFQDGALLGSLTLEENIALPLKEHTGLDPEIISKLVRQNLGMVGLADYLQFYPNELSGGMRKRAGLARAMITSPPVLLCDEPTSGLDPVNSAQMDQLLLNMKKQNPTMTIVVVSHDIKSLQKIAEHVLVLNEGKIAFSGPVADLYKSDDKYLKSFLNRSMPETDLPYQHNAGLTDDQQELLQNALDEWLDKK